MSPSTPSGRWPTRPELCCEAGLEDAELAAVNEGDLDALVLDDSMLVAYARSVAIGGLRHIDQDRSKNDSTHADGFGRNARQFLCNQWPKRSTFSMSNSEAEFVGWGLLQRVAVGKRRGEAGLRRQPELIGGGDRCAQTNPKRWPATRRF